MPSFCAKPFATSIALFFSTFSISLNFVLCTPFTPIFYFPVGRSTKSHVLFLSIESISSFIASTHVVSLIVSLKYVGWNDSRAYCTCSFVLVVCSYMSLRLLVFWFLRDATMGLVSLLEGGLWGACSLWFDASSYTCNLGSLCIDFFYHEFSTSRKACVNHWFWFVPSTWSFHHWSFIYLTSLGIISFFVIVLYSL